MKTLKISELIRELETWKERIGDSEVFMTNEHEAVFDGVGKLFVILSTLDRKQYLALLRNTDVLKI